MNRFRITALSLALLCVLLVAGVVLAAPQAFEMSRWTVAGGGGTSAGEAYTLASTIGQAEAGYQMSGGEYTLAGGFRGAGGVAPPPQWDFYLPVISR
jgi:hypothetical protein